MRLIRWTIVHALDLAVAAMGSALDISFSDADDAGTR